MNKLVSIVIPNFNKEKYLRDCLDSVLRQTYENLEVIVVDDGSTDNSVEIIESYAKEDPRLVFFPRQHYGKVDAINYGVAKSKGAYLKLWASDDVLDLSAVEQLLNACKCADVVAHDCSVTDEHLNIIKKSLVDFNTHSDSDAMDAISDIIRGQGHPSGLYMLRRHVVDTIFPIDPRATYEDWYLYMMIHLNSFSVEHFDRSLGLYRQVPNSAFGGVDNKNKRIFHYRLERDIKMLELFGEILPVEYVAQVEHRTKELQLTVRGTFKDIMCFEIPLSTRLKILIKRFWYEGYVNLLRFKDRIEGGR